MPRNPIEKCNVTWSQRYGTASDVEGNLPEYKRTECVEDIVTLSGGVWNAFPWVTYFDFHYHHVKCPFSNESENNYVRNIDPNDQNYWNLELVMPEDRVNHINTDGMMIRYARGSKYGWLCVDPVCKYYLGTVTISGVQGGVPYFYI